MSLTIGVRFIESGKSKGAMIISEIRRRNAYLSGTLTRVERRSLGPIGDSGEDGATGSKIGGSYAGDRTGDESSREAADVEESSTSSGLRGRKRSVKMGDSEEGDADKSKYIEKNHPQI